MKRLVVLSVCVVVSVELAALALHDRRLVLWVAGAAVVFALINVRRYLGHDAEPSPAVSPNGLEESLRNWLSRTETMIHWSESTRSDWDRHLRPMLARRFAITTGQKQSKDPVAFHATGRMLFGAELWAWVDPNNVAQTGGREPGPGRATLERILERLEQV
ncbi:hypothetical protein H7K24_16125 [Mycobacterium fragae]|jgi:hypothetical protein|uniref:Uncharacterized protein n=1 Tax=Mycobacterium fragae TaxID=1260918 RepID=A0A1X1UYR3_9MYCO|nr:hypothetical protein [Mycobacterium fragae]MCV7401667.1 hypothetical protein [Mycobacterium fragae]ORV61955.1 hypothetical protein AWC06_11275 [Mycobacterium fragae]